MLPRCRRNPMKSSSPYLLVLRGITLNRTYGTLKNLYISLFLPTIFGPIYCGPPSLWDTPLGVQAWPSLRGAGGRVLRMSLTLGYLCRGEVGRNLRLEGRRNAGEPGGRWFTSFSPAPGHQYRDLFRGHKERRPDPTLVGFHARARRRLGDAFQGRSWRRRRSFRR